MDLYKPNFNIAPSIIKKIESVCRMQGELEQGLKMQSNNLGLYSAANIDAVHFSTKLEGNRLTRKQVTHALQGKIKNIGAKRDLKEIVNYSKARQWLKEQSDSGHQLSLPMLLKTHDLLMKGIVGATLRGSFRVAQNVIRTARSGSIVYLPPEHQEVPALTKSLIKWLNTALKDGTSPLIAGPVFHYRFVTIHPFMDGNGRAARLLTNYILLSHGYPVNHIAAIEKQHEKNRGKYYSSLRQLQAGNFYDIPKYIDLTSWLEYWLECLEATYAEALSRIGSRIQTKEIVSTEEKRLDRAEALFRKHKKMSARDYQTLTGLGRTWAVADLNALVKAKIIKRFGGGRSTVYQIR